MKIKRDIRFAWPQEDGTVALSQVGDGALVSDDDAACIAAAAAVMKDKGVMPADAEPVRIDAAQIPTDRTYRAAWRLVDGAIAIDAEKKAEIDARAAEG